MGCSVGMGCGFVRGSQASSLPPPTPVVAGELEVLVFFLSVAHCAVLGLAWRQKLTMFSKRVASWQPQSPQLRRVGWVELGGTK